MSFDHTESGFLCPVLGIKESGLILTKVALVKKQVRHFLNQQVEQEQMMQLLKEKSMIVAHQPHFLSKECQDKKLFPLQ